MMQYVKNSGNTMYIKRPECADCWAKLYYCREDVLQTHIMQTSTVTGVYKVWM